LKDQSGVLAASSAKQVPDMPYFNIYLMMMVLESISGELLKERTGY
jgi:hypothetical protein